MCFVQTFFTIGFYYLNIPFKEGVILLGNQMIFKRYEMKYMITMEQLEAIKEEFEKHMSLDKYGKSTICSLYFDTPDFRLIRRSIEKPIYKEKLRVRSYGVAKPDSHVFVELKKKYKKVVYKRRIDLKEEDAMLYLSTKSAPVNSQIAKEIDYALDFYKELSPAMLLTYDREAYYGKDDPDFRVTFDTNVLWRDYDLSLTKGIYGNPILDDQYVLMEVKTADAVPLWLVKLLSEHHIYKTSFSKYGTAYKILCTQTQKGNLIYA